MLVKLFPLNEIFDHMVSQKPIWQQKMQGWCSCGYSITAATQTGGCFLGHVNVMSNAVLGKLLGTNQPTQYLVPKLSQHLILAFMATLTKCMSFSINRPHQQHLLSSCQHSTPPNKMRRGWEESWRELQMYQTLSYMVWYTYVTQSGFESIQVSELWSQISS